MAIAEGRPKFGILTIGSIILLFSLYQLALPFLARTQEISQEIHKLKEEITKTRMESQIYSKKWEAQMNEKERTLAVQLPENLNSSDVLDYFLMKFESKHPGLANFLSMNHQPASATNVKIEIGKKWVNALSGHYKITAEITQETAVPYLDHIEKYPGLFRLETFTLNSPKQGGPFLEMELALEFYLLPKEWLSPGTVISEPESQIKLSEADVHSWFQIFSSPKSRQISSLPANKHSVFRIEQMLGESVVIDENIYEAGDTIYGWKIMRIDPRQRIVILKKGSLIQKVVVR